MTADDCFACRNSADPDAPPRERILVTEHWRAAHAFDAGIPGWTVLVPLAHIRSLDELTPAAAEELGTLLRRLTAALREVTGCAKTCVLLLAEAEGFGHLHFHVVPRAVDLAPELLGPRIFGALGLDETHRVPPAEQDAVAARLGEVLARV